MSFIRVASLFILSFGFVFGFEGWAHLELGAGNYGEDGHTQASLSGDYGLIDARETLKDHGLSKYTSLHLKNPEISLYHNKIDWISLLTLRRLGKRHASIRAFSGVF